jgi:4-phospho-D-threonate 3-dehydrogenase / 4-phospho-D-erythronate 3-dehydrogenase
MGDPAGVGPELCLRLLNEPSSGVNYTPMVFGDWEILQRVSQVCNLPLSAQRVSGGDRARSTIDQPTIVDCGQLQANQVQPGVVNPATGLASYTYIDHAIRAALAKQVDAVCTGPIHKEAWLAAGIHYPGHTELFADRCHCDRFCMMMTAPSFSCSLVTTHVGYAEVVSLLTTELIWEVTELTHQALFRILGRKPKLAMLGLNPHAGEHGLFGNREEQNIIEPAVAIARQLGVEITEPLPPDTAFLPWRREQIDGYICMYHDQGLIPFKAFNFDSGVNITLGLPIIRTSVDHGTALDIAWHGKADPSSLIAAVRLAARLASR